MTMAWFVEARDPYTGGHLWRVSQYARMLAGHPLAALVHNAIYQHHERPDGKGYPLGLAGTAISDMAAIVGICDAFDAMTNSRPYRKGMPLEKALSIIQAEQGQQFRADYAHHFLALGQAGQLHREQQAGELVYCPNCTGEFRLARGDTGPVPEPTGRMGTAADLEPRLDAALIARSVQAAVQALPMAEWLGSA